MCASHRSLRLSLKNSLGRRAARNSLSRTKAVTVLPPPTLAVISDLQIGMVAAERGGSNFAKVASAMTSLTLGLRRKFVLITAGLADAASNFQGHGGRSERQSNGFAG